MNISAPTPVNPSKPYEYGSISNCPEEVQEYCEKIHDSLTIEQLRSLSDYFSQKANKLRELADKSVTIEDFESAKKEEADEDDEVGEGAEKGYSQS